MSNDQYDEVGILSERCEQLEETLNKTSRELRELNQIGIALSVEHDLQKLLELILAKSRMITGADAGSIYIVETKKAEIKTLRFKLAQNDSLKIPFKEFTLPIDKKSMAGYVAVTGETVLIDDVYNIPKTSQLEKPLHHYLGEVDET